MPKHSDSVLNYIRTLYAPQDALLEAVDHALEKAGFPIHIGAEEGKILQLLITMNRVKTIVEIGTLAGYSTLWMARALPEDGHIYTLNKDKAHIAMARDFFARSEVADKITMLEGDAHKTLPTLAAYAPFDMVFIDADKISYPDYLNWAEGNIKSGGLIVADNSLLFGHAAEDTPPENIAPTTWKKMREFNARLADKTRYVSVIIPTQEGLSVAVKR